MTSGSARPLAPAASGSSAHPGRPRQEVRPDRLAAVGGIAAAAALVALLTTDPQPTGSAIADVALTLGLVVAATLAGSRAHRRVLAFSALVLVPAAGLPWLVLALVTAAAVLVMLRLDVRDRVAGAAVGALIGTTALHLERPGATAATAVVAAISLVPLLVSGYRMTRRRGRRVVRRVLVGLGAVAVLGVLAAAVFGAQQRQRLADAADAAVDAAGSIGAEGGVDADAFRTAGDGFDQAVGAAGSWWMAPARSLPGLGPNVAAVGSAAAAASEVTRTAAQLGEELDLEAVRRDDGGVDLATLASYGPVVDGAVASLDGALARIDASNSTWLALPLRDRLVELREQLSTVADDARTAAAAVDVLPGMLGADGPRRYLLLLGNPAEARDLGGHIGNWAEVVAVDGRLELVRVGQPYDLFGPGRPAAAGIGDRSTYPDALMGLAPDVFPQNWGGSSDLPTVARLAAELYPQGDGGAPIDGVIYADPRAFAALLELTGPVQVPGRDAPLSSEDAVEYLTRGQYVGGDADRTTDETIRAALTEVTSGRLPGPDRLAAALGPAVAGGHLRMTSLRPQDAALLDRLGLDRRIDPDPGAQVIGVVSRNDNPSKIDSYLQRDVTTEVRWDPATGRTESEVVVRLTNTAPASGLPTVVGLPPPGGTPGTNRSQTALITSGDLVGAQVDGVDAPVARQDETPRLRRYTLTTDIAPGATAELRFRLTDAAAPDAALRLRWLAQPLAIRDRSEVVVRRTDGPFPDGSAVLRWRPPDAGDGLLVVPGVAG